jgi:ABC-2 type transport system ATP-binding protein
MSVRETFDYLASFRDHWNRDSERDLLARFHLDPTQRTAALSKGQRTQVALIAAICPEPDLLVLDEPTSGLDPIVRREFIETVIGTYQEGSPGNRTILVSTHLIAEFEGLIDEFTIMDHGREVMSLGADAARDRYRKIRARFVQSPPELNLEGAWRVQRTGRELDLIVNDSGSELLDRIKQRNPEALTTESLTLEEIFVATFKE